jgi:CheY-like chemotaxis protein
MLAGQTLLVVDKSSEAQALKSALGQSSYRVLTASSGERALDILRTGAPVDLVLAEIAVPGMPLVGRIKAAYPDTAVMLMAAAGHPPLDAAIPILVKPFTPSILVQRVQQVLSESHRTSQSLATLLESNRIFREELAAARRANEELVQKFRWRRAQRLSQRLRQAHFVPTVLVAEDDQALRYSICRYLRRFEFTVLAASDAGEAIQVSRGYPGRIDILVTDFRMPGLGCLELADVLAAERPRTGILFMTASETGLPRPMLRKPFELDDLLAGIVTELLGP